MKEGEIIKERKELLEEMFSHKDYTPLKEKEIAILLSVATDDRPELRKLLDEMVSNGVVIRTKKGKFIKPKDMQLIIGDFIGHQKGFGFVVVEDRDDDIFIPAKFKNGAFHGDKVAIKLLKGQAPGKRQEGEIVSIVKRGMVTVVGTYQKNINFGFVVPDLKKMDRDLFIPKGDEMDAVTGHKVVAKITDYGDATKKPQGEIVEIIGHIDEPGTDIMSIVRALEIPHEFPEEVITAAQKVPESVEPGEVEGRLDIRDQKTVTIDGADAKDLDDAITISKIDDGYRLGVHIADVTHYVQEGSDIDKEAVLRGTSVYLADRVIPMLPRRLSNGICSLNEGVDRLALSCIMDINLKGEVTDYKIANTLINVDHRMTYVDVRKIIQNEDAEVTLKYKDFLEEFKMMEAVSVLLRKKRDRRGAIDFDFTETKVILDDQGKPIEIKEYERNVATKLIEECMLLANETVSEHFYWQQVPFVYRSHDDPNPERLKALMAFVKNFGYTGFHTDAQGEIHPKQIQQLLNDVEGSPEELVISRLTLRSMQKATYTTTSDGHYGLAAEHYSHFTSPIRRYPDLQIHRIIKESLANKLNAERQEHYGKLLPNIAKKCSEFERRAEEAERETVKLKKVEFMTEHIGEEFDGIVSSVTSFGLFIELENTIEGLVHVTALDDDYYIFNEANFTYIGERRGNIYRLGQTVRIKVANADVQQRIIDFVMVKDK